MFGELKKDYPIFSKYPKLKYFDSAATSQRPEVVVKAINDFNAYENANIHRGVYDLSNQATQKYEQIRLKTAEFLGSSNANNIAFTSGTTESINVVAQSFLANQLKKGDNVVTTIMEHHANFIPWQMLADQMGAELRVVPVTDQGDLILDEFDQMIDHRTKLVACSHVSNTLGTINPIKEIIQLTHDKNVPVLIDAAQSIAYENIDCNELDYDFLTFSGHKMFGPFGIGVLYVADKYIEQVKPFNYGGGMIKSVSLNGTSFANYPFNMEAGTANIAGVVGLGAAIDYIKSLGKEQMKKYLIELIGYAESKLNNIDLIKVLGNPVNRAAVFSFNVSDIHPHDVASFLNQDEIAVRAGMHCTQPLLAHFKTPATVRASFSVYNNKAEIDELSEALEELIKFWQ